MFHFAEARIRKMTVNIVGNKLRDEGFLLSENVQDIGSGELQELLYRYFTASFKDEANHKFYHDVDLSFNEIYSYVSNIFARIDEDGFVEMSHNISRYLYENSLHPRIKKREVYIVHFENCYLDEKYVEAVGIFLSENKDFYLRVNPQLRGVTLDYETGTNVNKLDKGCIVFNVDREQGYRVAIVDIANRGQDAHYWRDRFLKVEEREIPTVFTGNLVKFVSSFANSEDREDGDRTRSMQLQNDALNYLRSNQQFDLQAFANEVLEENEIGRFLEQRAAYEESRKVTIGDNFTIEPKVVEREIKKVKFKLILDRKIEVRFLDLIPKESYEELIDKGYDEVRGKKFLRIFYSNEE